MSANRSTLRKIVGYSRVALGAALFLQPDFATKAWLGPDAEVADIRLLFRSIGARDIVLGTGLLGAAPDDTSWARAGTLADIGDTVASLLNLRSKPAAQVLPGAALAAVFVAAGASLSRPAR